MKNLKDTLSSILAALIVISGSIFGLIETGTLSNLPEWVKTACVIIPVIATAIIGVMTGKNADLSTKKPTQIESQKKAE